VAIAGGGAGKGVGTAGAGTGAGCAEAAARGTVAAGGVAGVAAGAVTVGAEDFAGAGGAAGAGVDATASSFGSTKRVFNQLRDEQPGSSEAAATKPTKARRRTAGVWPETAFEVCECDRAGMAGAGASVKRQPLCRADARRRCG
jgi:hypothetical protein